MYNWSFEPTEKFVMCFFGVIKSYQDKFLPNTTTVVLLLLHISKLEGYPTHNGLDAITHIQVLQDCLFSCSITEKTLKTKPALPFSSKVSFLQ
jgi:hypothetical protein